ncbi:anti-sigma regulatory factor [Magnetospirillum molischianum]|uniref:Serine/threonine-protein kinase rsbT n=1 Tax=Magnetospirillum molischianum DSM 120 TaxID=1150626 RepID=H8FVH1_MAGML|nr:anti-sigma regulatory factor [Magnetospirillum molischianum]CCG42359.1 Serine/threonine-protein kinase rsbT [Magnetospirillum molischianum DSM 120]
MEKTINFSVQNELDGTEVRLYARQMAQSLGLPHARVYRLSTAISELVNNLAFHTVKGGIVHLTPIEDCGKIGIEVVTEDDGPGIDNIELAMQDGFSTNGGLGSGLPGIQRLMDEFHLESKLGSGTRVVARIWDR